MASKQQDYYREFADKLIDRMKAGTAPWQKPWEPGETALPANVHSERSYTGGPADAGTGPPRAAPPRSSRTDRRCWPRPTPPGPTASWVARRELRNSRWRSGSTAHSPSRRSMEQSRPTGERRGH